MIYCMSDIHGRIDLFEMMLEKINLQSGDMLYVIGDCIDRGGGLQVLKKIKKLHDKGMATLLMGNHELMFWFNYNNHKDNKYIEDALDRIKEIQDNGKKYTERSNEINKNPSISGLFEVAGILKKKLEELGEMNILQTEIQKSLTHTSVCSRAEEWETFEDFSLLSNDERSELAEFMLKLPYSKEITVNGKNYLLIHGGVAHGDLEESKIKGLFVRENFYMSKVNREQLKQNGFKEDCIVVFGHTTTRDINIRINHKYVAPHKIWFDETHRDKIGIDCGASYPNGQLACLRLDDMKEFYVLNEEKFITPIKKINHCLDKIRIEVIENE